MFELPELTVISTQMNETLRGKCVVEGRLGNSPHKFVWYDRSHEGFTELTRGLTIGKAWVEGKWLFLTLDPGYVLLLGEWGGRIRYHAPGESLPVKYHLCLSFSDDSAFTATTQMWGGVHLCEEGSEHEVKYVAGMRTTPVEEGFTLPYFRELAVAAQKGGKRSVKGLLTQDQLVPGLGNAIAQDIMFRAKLDPRRGLDAVSDGELAELHAAITCTVADVIAAGGRYDERDLFDEPGGYVRIMDAKAVACACPSCGTPIKKISYLGGACYFCPACQK